MKVIVCRVGEDARVEDIGSGLSAMQKVVGGYIEAIYPYEEEVAIILNEEGKLMGLPFNRALINDDGRIVDVMCGDFFICGIGEEDFTDIQDEYVDKFINEMDSSNLSKLKSMFNIRVF